KTTAVRILSTILRPDAGEASVLGHDVVREPDVVRTSIGLAGQYAAVDENLTGAENLRMVGKLTHLPRSLIRERAAELLERFDHARIIAQGTPAELKSGLGSTVIEIGMPGEGSSLMALQALASFGVQAPTLDGTTVKLTVANGPSVLLDALRALDTEGIAPTGV